MRVNGIVLKNNLNEFDISGSFDLSAAAAVVAGGTRADGCSVTKASTGTYTVRMKASDAAYLRAHELISGSASFIGSGTPATVTGARVTTVTNDTTAGSVGDILITVVTHIANFTATDTTGACTVSFRVSVRTKPAV